MNACIYLQNAAKNTVLSAATEEQRKVDEKLVRLAEEQKVWFLIIPSIFF